MKNQTKYRAPVMRESLLNNPVFLDWFLRGPERPQEKDKRADYSARILFLCNYTKARRAKRAAVASEYNENKRRSRLLQFVAEGIASGASRQYAQARSMLVHAHSLDMSGPSL